MSKILINTTAIDQVVSDVGKTVLANSSYTIPPQEYPDWAGSSDVVTLIGNGTLVVNDGSVNLSISDGIDLIKGIYPKAIQIENSTGQVVNVTNNKLDVNAHIVPDTVLLKTNKQLHFKLNGTGSDNMKVDGSVTPQNFKIMADPTDHIYVTELVFYAIINDSKPVYNINYFLVKTLPALVNGITFQFKTNDVTYTPFLPVKRTEHLINHIASGNTTIVVEGELDFSILKVTHKFEQAYPVLCKQGSFATDDYLQITINDNLIDSQIIEIEAIINGYSL